MTKIYIKTLVTVFVLVLISATTKAQPNIIINEISQGDMGDHDWIELVVTEDITTVEGIYFTTQFVSSDFSNKSVQLALSNSNLQNLPKGTVIVIYKSNTLSSTYDPTLGTIPDVDFTGDNKIVIPSDNSTGFLQGTPNWPSFVGAGSNIGLMTSSGVGIHAVSYGNGGVSTIFGPGTWGQAHVPSTMTAGDLALGSLYYTQQSSGEASNSSNWALRSYALATPGVIDGIDDRGTPVSTANIIINEISQGDNLDHDWIELVVTENVATVEGVYFTTQLVSSDFTAKSVQLSLSNPNLQNLPKGTSIVIYKSNTSDGKYDPTLGTIPDVDFTGDNKIVIPSDNTSGFLKETPSWPSFQELGSNIGLLTSSGVGIHAVAYGNGVLSSIFGPGTYGQVSIPTTMTYGTSTASLHYNEGTIGEAKNSANWITALFSDATPGSLNGGNNNALPVELSSFSAVINKASVNLIWKTETEVNNYGFEVQRSSDNKDWETLGFVNGNGNSNSPKNYSFEDNAVGTSGKYSYRLKQIDNDGTYEFSKMIEVNLGSPVSIELKQNYPNPFNPTTTINFTLPVDDAISLIVYNAIGEQVKVLYNGTLEAGVHSFNFNGDGFPSGLYIYRLSTSSNTQVRKMMLLK